MIVSTKRNPDALEKAVLEYAKDMLKKLNKKKSDGWTGWKDESFFREGKWTISPWKHSLNDHISRAKVHDRPIDWVDVGNFCMFRHAFLNSQPKE